MILVSEDGKSLVKIDSWDDVLGRPGYEPSVNPLKVSLKQIIGRYYVEPKQPCGISSCGTEHNKGYLVVCEGGIETNIGNKCGKKIFGVDFQHMEKIFNRDTNAQRYRENIDSFQHRLGEYTDRISALVDGEAGAMKYYDEMRWHATKGFEEKTLDALHKKAKNNDGRIFEQIPLTKEEKEIAKSTGGNTEFKEVLVGTIAGIQAVMSYKNLRTLVAVDFGEDLQQFKSLQSALLNFDELKHWNRWASRLDAKIREATTIVQDCQRFLLQPNIQFIRQNKHRL